MRVAIYTSGQFGKPHLLAIFELQSTGAVCIENKAPGFVGNLEKHGVKLQSGKTVMPSAGGAFLKALLKKFISAYLFAKEEVPHSISQ